MQWTGNIMLRHEETYFIIKLNLMHTHTLDLSQSALQ